MSRILLLALAQCVVLGSLTAPAVVGLSLIVQDLVGSDAAPGALGVVIACGSAAAMALNPLFGWCADRTPARLGGRRGWLVAGALAGLAGSWWLVTADGLVSLTAAWVLTQAVYNACFAAINGLLSAALRPEHRTRAAGAFTAAGFLGTLPGLAAAAFFPDEVVAMTLVVPAIAAVVILAAAPFLRDPRTTPAVGASGTVRSLLTRPFVTAFVIRFVFAAELTAGLVYGLYLFQERWQLATVEAVRLVSASTLIGAVGLVAVSALLAGARTRASATRPLLATAIVLLVAAMLARGFAPTPLAFQAATLLAGVAIGVGHTVTRAIVQAHLPGERSAFGLGIFNIANTLAPVIAPLASGALLAAGAGLPFGDRYAGFYVLLAVPVLLCVVLVPGSSRRESETDAARSERTSDRSSA